MRHAFHNILTVVLGLGVVSAVAAGERLPISSILTHPAGYRAKVVTVEGHARAVTTLPVHRGTRHCGGSVVYDSQTFTLRDQSGTIGIGTRGTCLPNMTTLVQENDHLRIRGVVVADEHDPKGLPVIYAEAIDRMTR